MLEKLPVIVINLDRSPERLASMARQLGKQAVPWERFPAIDARNLGPELSAAGYSPVLNRRQYHVSLNPGEVACFASHRHAWQLILEQGWGAAVILEDDAVLAERFSAALAMLAGNRNRWSAVKLHNYNRRRLISSTLLDEIGEWTIGDYLKIPNCTTGYAIAAAAAAQLFEKTQEFGCPIDVTMQYWWRTGVRFQGLEPNIVTTGAGQPSLIDAWGKRKADPRRRFARFWQQMAYNAQVYRRVTKRNGIGAVARGLFHG
jgi:glycosyl transferase family 25